MKSSSKTTWTLEFPMKDGKKVHSFDIKATSQEEAEKILQDELLECCTQLADVKKERERQKTK